MNENQFNVPGNKQLIRKDLRGLCPDFVVCESESPDIYKLLNWFQNEARYGYFVYEVFVG